MWLFIILLLLLLTTQRLFFCRKRLAFPDFSKIVIIPAAHGVVDDKSFYWPVDYIQSFIGFWDFDVLGWANHMTTYLKFILKEQFN